MTQQNTQAIVLQQPTDQMIRLDLQHSTDWVVVISVVGSAFISFIGFLITIYVVKKSTESQIKSNKYVVEEQNLMLITQLKITNKLKELSDFRKSVANYYYWGMKVNNESISKIYEYYNLHDDENKGIELKESVRIRVDELNALISQMLVYLDYSKDKHNIVRDNLFKVMKASFDVYASIGTTFENSHQKINVFNEIFGKTQGNLNTLISEEINVIYEKKAA